LEVKVRKQRFSEEEKNEKKFKTLEEERSDEMEMAA